MQETTALILLEKLYNISSDRISFMPAGDRNLIFKIYEGVGSYLFSIGTKLNRLKKQSNSKKKSRMPKVA